MNKVTIFKYEENKLVRTMDISGDYADAFTIGKEVDFTFSGSACHVFGSDGKNLEF